jgi:hypothetical protein
MPYFLKWFAAPKCLTPTSIHSNPPIPVRLTTVTILIWCALADPFALAACTPAKNEAARERRERFQLRIHITH